MSDSLGKARSRTSQVRLCSTVVLANKADHNRDNVCNVKMGSAVRLSLPTFNHELQSEG